MVDRPATPVPDPAEGLVGECTEKEIRLGGNALKEWRRSGDEE